MKETGHLTDFGLDDLSCGCIVVDEMRRVTFANRYITDEFGWDPDQRKGKRMDDFMSRASQLFCESYVYPMLVKDGKCNEVQLTFVSPQGKRTPVGKRAGKTYKPPSSI